MFGLFNSKEHEFKSNQGSPTSRVCSDESGYDEEGVEQTLSGIGAKSPKNDGEVKHKIGAGGFVNVSHGAVLSMEETEELKRDMPKYNIRYERNSIKLFVSLQGPRQ